MPRPPVTSKTQLEEPNESTPSKDLQYEMNSIYDEIERQRRLSKIKGLESTTLQPCYAFQKD